MIQTCTYLFWRWLHDILECKTDKSQELEGVSWILPGLCSQRGWSKEMEHGLALVVCVCVCVGGSGVPCAYGALSSRLHLIHRVSHAS